MKILTLPIKPSSFQKKGMYLAPLLADLLAKKLNNSSLTFLNLIDSYKNQNEYIQYLEAEYQNLGIAPDQITSDQENKSKLYELIGSLANKGYIFERECNILNCPCGKIDCLEESLNSKTGRTNYNDTDNTFCKICNNPCNIIRRKALLFCVPQLIKSKAPVYPLFSHNDINEFNTKFAGKCILISKQRDTQIPFSFNGNQYNLDVDFFWANYASLWNDERKIIMSSQHSIYPSFLINILHQIHHPDAQLMTIFLPYIRNKNNVNIEEDLSKLSIPQKQLYLMYSLKFRDKIADWHPSAFSNISKMSDESIEQIYKTLATAEQFKTSTFQTQVIYNLQKMNVQTIIQNSKKKQINPLFQKNNGIAPR